MALESASLRGKFAYGAEAENLESSAVGKNRMVPVLEAVQSACGAQYVQAGTQIKMIGVAEYYFGFHIVFKVFMVNPLHGAHGTYRHKDWGAYVPVVGMQDATTGR